MPSRACCVEFDEKQPSPHGTSTSAMLTRPTPSGHSASEHAIRPIATVTATFGPTRSITRVSTTLPIRPKAPNHISSSVICSALAPSFSL